MNDYGDDIGDFAEEPTDPGPGSAHQRPDTGHGAPPEAVNNLGFRPQTGAFGAVGGPVPQGGAPGSSQFGNTPSRSPQPPAHAPPQQGVPQSGQQPGQGPVTGQFSAPMANPTGSFNVSTGEFSSPAQGAPSGQPRPNPHGTPGPSSGQFRAPSQSNQQQTGFAPPMTGGFEAVQGHQKTEPGHQQHPQHQQQQVGYPTGPLPSVGGPHTGSFQAPGSNQSLQVGEFVDGPPKPTFKIRALYGGGGFVFGFIIGVGLGLLNSLFEGADLIGGIGVTLQIAVWFGGMIGLIAAWKPQKVWETLESYGFFD